MRLSLVHNRKAGGGAALRRRDIAALLEEFGHEVVHSVGKKDDWTDLLADPGDAIAVAGGDGTVGAVARALIGREVPLAVLPLGTANNIARALGVGGEMRDVIASWDGASRMNLNLGIATGPWGKTWFVEGCGLGVVASAIARLSQQDKLGALEGEDPQVKLFRDRLALGTLAAEYPPLALQGTLDDADLSGEYLLLEALNLGRVGPGLELAPQADPSDGLLDFVLLPAERRSAFIDYVESLRNGRPAPPPVDVRRGQCLRLMGNGHDAHIDDRAHLPEPVHVGAHLDIEIRIDVQSVQVLVPRVTGSAVGRSSHSVGGRLTAAATVDA